MSNTLNPFQRVCFETTDQLRLLSYSLSCVTYTDNASSKSVCYAMCCRHNVCSQLHLPAQSGSTAMLKAMRRGYVVQLL